MADHFNLPPSGLTTEETENNGWVTIASLTSLQDAHILKGALDAEGIDAIINDQSLNTLFPLDFTALGHISLMVPADQADLALMILRRNGDSGE